MPQFSTTELLKLLRSSHSETTLKKYTSMLENQFSFHSFSEYITTFLKEHEISESELIKNSLLPRTYAYQILNGSKNPGRNKVLALCIAAGMNYEETQRALLLSNLGKLYPRRKEDSIVIFALEHKLNVLQTNELLYEECKTTL